MDESGILEAIRTMLLAVSEPLTDEDHLLVERAKSSMKGRFMHGYTQLLSLGIDGEGNELAGFQMDCPIGQESICAEVSVMQEALRYQRELATIVTVHHKKEEEGGEVHVVSSCEGCCGRLLHFFPDVRVIVWFSGELRKIPIRALIPLPYKRRRKNGTNGNTTHEFGG